MARARFQLTSQAAAALQAAEFAEKDGPTRARIQSVRLYGLGFPVPTIQTATGISRSRLLECCRAYRQHGIAALSDHRQGGNNYKLSPAQVAEVKRKLHQYTPRSLFGPDAATPSGQFWTLADLKRAVEQWCGVIYDSPTSYRSLFARCGFSYQRPDQVFKSRREADVLEWEARAEKN
jgi:transposase